MSPTDKADGGPDFFEHPDTVRLVNAYCSKGVLRPIPGADKGYDLAAHNVAALVVREMRRRRRAAEGAKELDGPKADGRPNPAPPGCTCPYVLQDGLHYAQCALAEREREGK